MERADRVILSVGALCVALAVATGAALLPGYRADPAQAHEASAAQPRLLVSAHAWSASLVLAVSFVVGARAFVAGSHGRRVLLAGVGVVALLLAAYEAGAVLPWDQQASEAWRHVKDGAALFAVRLPDSLVLVLVAHVVLAGAAAVLVAWGVRLDRRTTLVGAGLALAVVVGLAFVAPEPLGPAPVQGLYIGRPHWPFLWLVPVQTWYGTAGLLALPVAVACALALAWWVPKVRGVRIAILLVGVVTLGGLTLLGGAS